MSFALTMLAYYADGLDRKQIKVTIRQLLSLGLNAQRKFYQGWLELSKPRMPPNVFVSLDSPAKLDLSNSLQLEALHEYFRLNTRTIDFFLNTTVLPDEMQVYTDRMTANPWHLAQNMHGKIT